MNSRVMLIAVLLGLAGTVPALPAEAATSVVNSKHNLSLSGPGPVKSTTETRVCVFCHTPHNANPLSPLWNKDIAAVNYDIYTPYSSTTMKSAPAGPTGATRLCLSCHDGTIALGTVLRPSSPIAMSGAISTPFGQSLASHHPVSFHYASALPNGELVGSPPAGLRFYNYDIMQCTTCHDPHDNTNKKFLAVLSVNSNLCTMCHQMDGWGSTPHNTSAKTWNLTPPDPWPRTGSSSEFGWTTVQQNGCENCHAPHFAGGAKRLLNAQSEEDNCYPCHNGNVAATNILADFTKTSRHQVEATTIGITASYHDAGESPLLLTGHVECADCHNSHAANGSTAVAPGVSGMLARVSGVDINGSALVPPAFAAAEYEICFKCHASSSPQSGMSAGYPIPRVVSSVDKRTALQPTNPSFHPIAAAGQNSDVPSLLSPLTTSSRIYCTDCHDSDTSRSIGGAGPRGSHGSQYAPLIREQYLTADNTPESAANFALCYRCHNRSSILSDVTFQKRTLSGKGGHSGHLSATVNAPCSLCHDPHGIQDPGTSGSHTSLINFDTRYVSPFGTMSAPTYTDLGVRTGSCLLVCHGKSHDGSATYTYP